MRCLTVHKPAQLAAVPPVPRRRLRAVPASMLSWERRRDWAARSPAACRGADGERERPARNSRVRRQAGPVPRDPEHPFWMEIGDGEDDPELAEEAAQALEALRVSRGEAPADPRTALARCANLRRRIAENRLRATPIVRGVACPRCGEPAKPHLDPEAYAKRSGRPIRGGPARHRSAEGATHGQEQDGEADRGRARIRRAFRAGERHARAIDALAATDAARLMDAEGGPASNARVDRLHERVQRLASRVTRDVRELPCGARTPAARRTGCGASATPPGAGAIRRSASAPARWTRRGMRDEARRERDEARAAGRTVADQRDALERDPTACARRSRQCGTPPGARTPSSRASSASCGTRCGSTSTRGASC